MSTEVDWSQFDQAPESTCYCRCEATYRSHTKLIRDQDQLKHITRSPCPGCGRNDNLRRISGDPEHMEI